MTVRDLLKYEGDVDVVDDVVEELYIAFCGPMELTPEGEEHFAEVLDYPVYPNNYTELVIVGVDVEDADDSVWEARLEKAKEFFESAAGFCTQSDYDKWFKQ